MSLFRRRLLLNAGNTLSNSLIARYTCYDKTNEDEDRDILKDLSGNGHDIQLYNFAFSKNSGYGAYHLDYTTASSSLASTGVQKGVARNVTPTSFEFMPRKIDNSGNIGFGVYIGTGGNLTIKLECANIDDGNPVYIVPYNRTVEQQGIKIKLQNGINDVSLIYSDTSYCYFTIVSENTAYTEFVSFKTIPDYKGALVSDGVDDYGLCDNFPILTKDRGYTVLAIRKILQDKGCFLSNRDNSIIGAFGMELYTEGMWTSRTFNDGASIQNITPPELFTYQTANAYNGQVFTSTGGYTTGVDKLVLFNLAKILPTQYISSIALYSIEIYDRDLTDEEIAQVKARMIAEYEQKTGEKYTEETT